MTQQLFCFVEDPGSANFFVDLPQKLAPRNIAVRLVTAGKATPYLQSKGTKVEPFSTEVPLHEYFKDCAALLIGTGTNRSSPGFECVQIAKSKCIRSFSIVDAPTVLSERFKGHGESPLSYLTDFVFTASTEIKTGLTNLGIDASKIVLIRHPYYDWVLKKREQLSHLSWNDKRSSLYGQVSPDKTIVLFLSELSVGMIEGDFTKSDAYTLAGRTGSTKRSHVVLDELLDGLKPYRDLIHFVVRLHPRDDINDYKQYEDEVDAFNLTEDSIEMVYFADAVFGMTTNLLAEAALMHKRVLSIIPKRSEQTWIAQATVPSIPTVWNRVTLEEEIENVIHKTTTTAFHRADLEHANIEDCITSLMT